MAKLDDFKYVLTLWKERELPELIYRDIKLDFSLNKIITIAGVRRSGKTHIMFQHIKMLLSEGVPKDNIIYVDFENERLVGAKAVDLDDLLVAHSQLYNPNGKIYLFLDELQNVQNWDKWVRKIYNTGKYHIIITGSSSSLLSREIATALAGRNISYIVYPFSFEEFLTAKKIKLEKTYRYSASKGIILRAVDEFLEYGSFPEVTLVSDTNTKMDILSSYFDAIFFRDIVKRYGVRETGALNIFLKIITGNYASYFSSVKSYNYFKSTGFKISRITIIKFLEYSKSVFLIETMEQHLKSARKRLARQSKSYIVDIGISKLFSDVDKGRALENAVYFELLRKKGNKGNIHYLKLESGKEVDFMVGGKEGALIQVAYVLVEPETKQRETSAIVEAAKKLGFKSGTIITYDYDGEETMDGIKINYRPFWAWALDIQVANPS